MRSTQAPCHCPHCPRDDCRFGHCAHAAAPFETQGTLWADAPVPNDSTLFSMSQPSESAAAQDSSVLQELLDTNEFLNKIGQQSPWASYLRQHPSALGRLIEPVRKEAFVSVIGPQVISVGLTAHNSSTATVLDNAVIKAFLGEMATLRQTRDQQQIAYDQQSLQTATSGLNAAEQQMNAYLADHPQDVVGTTNDPTATQLSGNLATAEQLYDSAFSDYNSSELGLSHLLDSSQLHVIDSPNSPAAQGRKKKIAEGGVGGLLAGAAISMLLLTWVVWRDSSKSGTKDHGESLGLWMAMPSALSGYAATSNRPQRSIQCES